MDMQQAPQYDTACEAVQCSATRCCLYRNPFKLRHCDVGWYVELCNVVPFFVVCIAQTLPLTQELGQLSWGSLSQVHQMQGPCMSWDLLRELLGLLSPASQLHAQDTT